MCYKTNLNKLIIYIKNIKKINIFLYFLYKYNIHIKEFNKLLNKNISYKIYNNGILIYGNNNDNIISLYKGYVIYNNNYNKDNYILIIKHTNKLISVYINNNIFLLKKNSKVLKKQVISKIGINNKFYFEIFN